MTNQSDDLENKIKNSKLKRIGRKTLEWIKRYGPSETVGTITAISASYIVHKLTKNEVAAAYAGTIGENIGFYGTMIARDVRTDYKQAKENKGHYGVRDAFVTARNLVIEFGSAELVDTLVIRPLAMGYGTKFIGQRGLGVFAGKLAADISFYIPVLVAYELRKKHLPKNKK